MKLFGKQSRERQSARVGEIAIEVRERIESTFEDGQPAPDYIDEIGVYFFRSYSRAEKFVQRLVDESYLIEVWKTISDDQTVPVRGLQNYCI